MEEEPPKKKKGSLIALGLIGFLVLLFFLTPSILSLPFARGLVTRPLARALKGSVSIDKLHLSWFGTQSLEQIKVTSQQIRAQARLVEIHHPLFWILLNQTGGALVLEDPVLEMHTTQEIKKKGVAGLSFEKIDVHNGRLILALPEKSKISLEHVQLSYVEEQKLVVEGDTQVEEQPGHFHVTASKEGEHFNLTGDIQDFPLIAPDALLSLFRPHTRGLITAALGDVLSAHIDLHLSMEDISASIAINAPLFHGTLKTVVQDNNMTVLPTSGFQWVMVPHFVETFAKQSPLSNAMMLSSDCTMQIHFDAVQCPISGTTVDWKSASGALVLEGGPCHFTTQGQKGELTAEQFAFTLSTQKLNLAIGARFHGDLIAPKGEKTSLETHVTFTDPFKSMRGSFTQHDFFALFHLKTENFPLYVLDDLFDTRYHFAKYLGPTINLHIHPIPVRDQVRVTIDTPYLHIDPMDFSVQDMAYLQKPATFRYAPPGEIQWGDITRFGAAVGDLTLLAVPISPWEGSLSSVVIESSLSIENLQIDPIDSFGRIAFENPQVAVHANSLEKVHITASSRLTFPNEDELSHRLLGESVEASIKMIAAVKSLNDIEIPECLVGLHSDRISGEFDIELLDHFQTVKLVRPLDFNLFIASEVFNEFLIPAGMKVMYSTAAPLRIHLKPTTFKFEKPYSYNLDLELDAYLKELDLVNNQWQVLYTWKDTHFKLYSKKESTTLSLDCSSYAYQGDRAVGSLEGNLSTDNFFKLSLKQTDFSGDLQLKDFSSELTDLALGHQSIEVLLGKKYDLDLTVVHTHPALDFKLDLNSPEMKLKTEMLIDTTIHSKAPLIFDFTMSPDSFEQLKHHLVKNAASKEVLSQIALEKACHLKGDIDQLVIPRLPEAQKKRFFDSIDFNPENITFVGEIGVKEISLEDRKSGKTASLHGASLKGGKKSAGLFLTLTTETKIGKNVEGNLNGHMNVYPQDSGNRCEINGQFKKFPTIFIDAFLPFFYSYSYPIRTIFGPTFSGNSSVDFTNGSGHILVDLTSTNTSFKLDGILTNGKLVLSHPIHSQFDLTPELGTLILDDFGTAFVSAKGPVDLSLSDQGFVFYLNPFSITKSYIPKLRLDLGQIICAAKGNPRELATVFKQKYGETSQIALWFAPLDAQLRGGILHIERTEILFDHQFEVAIWGKVDLENEYIDMVLGITAASLKQAFHLDLPPDFVLPIPLKGSFKKVKLGVDVATAKLALLFAKQKDLKPSGSWGSVIDIASDLANDQSDIPPAKRPFPWN